jgi:predicted RNase H-like HicB family nuclease
MARTVKKRKRKIESGTRQFAVVLTAEGKGWYSVSCPSLPGCHSQGKGIDQALANIRAAIELVLEDLADHNEELPQGDALLATVRV